MPRTNSSSLQRLYFFVSVRSQKLWLPGAVTAAFAAYLTWSAVLSQPKGTSSLFSSLSTNTRTLTRLIYLLVLVETFTRVEPVGSYHTGIPSSSQVELARFESGGEARGGSLLATPSFVGAFCRSVGAQSIITSQLWHTDPLTPMPTQREYFLFFT